MRLLDTPLSPSQFDRPVRAGNSLRRWWQASATPSIRVADATLMIICLLTIFSTAFVQLFVVTLTLTLAWCAHANPSFSFRRTPLDIPYLAFVLGRLASVMFSQDPARSVPAISIEFCFYGVFFLATQTIRANESDAARVLISIFVWAGVVAAVVGTLKVGLSLDSRASSTTAGTYTLGAFLCPVLCLALLAPYAGNSRRVWRWLPPVLICIGIVLTFDRLHWAAMALALIATAFLSPRRKLAFALCALLAGSILIPAIRVRALQMADVDVLMSGRDVLWRGAALLASKHPLFGFGPRTFAEIFPYFELLPFRGVGSWHNDYVQVYMESGLAALVPLLWLVVATLTYAVRYIRSDVVAPTSRRLMLSLTVAVGLVFLIGGVLDTLVGIMFRILLALLALLVADRKIASPAIAISHEASAPPRAERAPVLRRNERSAGHASDFSADPR